MRTTRLVWDLVAALGCLRCLRGFWLQVTVLGPAGGVGLVDCLQLLHLPGYAIIPRECLLTLCTIRRSRNVEDVRPSHIQKMQEDKATARRRVGPRFPLRDCSVLGGPPLVGPHVHTILVVKNFF